MENKKITQEEIKELKRLYDKHGHDLELFANNWLTEIVHEYETNPSYNPINKDCRFICNLLNEGISWDEMEILFRNFAIDEIKPMKIKCIEADIKKFGFDNVNKYFQIKYRADRSKLTGETKRIYYDMFRVVEEHENISSLLITIYPYTKPDYNDIMKWTILLDMKYLNEQDVKGVLDKKNKQVV